MVSDINGVASFPVTVFGITQIIHIVLAVLSFKVVQNCHGFLFKQRDQEVLIGSQVMQVFFFFLLQFNLCNAL